MSIETIGSMKEILGNYNSRDWTKSTDLKIENSEMGGITGKLQDLKISGGSQSFSELLANSIGEVNNLQKEANLAIQKLTTGKTKNLHETLLVVEKADIAFRTMNQIRMKVIDAYKEVMRMQI